jgi:LacI family transcriptional regulator
VVAPGDPAATTPLLEEASRRRIPVVCVSTDAPGAPRLSSIGIDPRTSGALVGELIGRCLGGRGAVALVSGSLATTDHAGKLEGLEAACRAWWPALRIAHVLEAHDDEREARVKMRALLAAPKRYDAVYVSTANSVPVLEEIDRASRRAAGRAATRAWRAPLVVTTDLFPALVPYIASGTVAATIHQRPRTQGRLAIDTLRRYLVDRVEPPATVRLSPHVVMRANVHLFVGAETS